VTPVKPLTEADLRQAKAALLRLLRVRRKSGSAAAQQAWLKMNSEPGDTSRLQGESPKEGMPMPQSAEPTQPSEKPSLEKSPEPQALSPGEQALLELEQAILDGAVKLGPNSPFVFHRLPPRNNKPGS
jgi:hypothetical protein